MKKLITFIFTVCLLMLCLQVFAVFNQPSNSTSLDNLGAVKHYDEMMISVKNVSGGSLTVGSFVVFDTTEDNGFGVTTSTNEEDKPACMLLETLADDGIGKCLVYGYTAVARCDGDTTAVAGRPGYISDEHGGDGRIEYVVPATAGSGGFQSAGIFLDATAASGTCEFFVNTI